MSLVTKNNTFSPGGTILSAEHNSNFDTIYDDYNGNITNANLSGSAGITDANLAQITTASKVAGSAMNLIFPVGSIYMNAAVSTNPGTLLGFGTWVAFGAGKVPIGVDSGDTDFDVVNSSTGSAGSGGAKTHQLTQAELPSANLTASVPFGSFSASAGAGQSLWSQGDDNGTDVTFALGGSDTAHNNVQPYITCYMWRRTV
jgi:hypothetical protein